MRKFFISGALILSLFLVACESSSRLNTPSSTTTLSSSISLEWQKLSEGLSFSRLKAEQKNKIYDLLLAKIDPQHAHFQIYQNTEKVTAKSIEEIHQAQKAQLTFNGAFFSPELKPVSLLISGEKTLHTISKADLLNGVFTITKNGKAALEKSENFQSSGNIDFAIQNGPILLNKDKQNGIRSDDQKLASRTAMGIDKDGNIIVILLKAGFLNDDNQISLYQFADLLQKNPAFSGIGLHSVLNLDGGPSTGMMIENVYYPEMDRVQNVILVK